MNEPRDEWHNMLLAEWIDELGKIMACASERCYSAGWLTGWMSLMRQYAPIVDETGQDFPLGRDVLRVAEARAMLELVALIGDWVTYSGNDLNPYRIVTPEDE